MVDAVIDEFGGERFIIGPAGREAAWVLLGGMERGLTEFALNPELISEEHTSELQLQAYLVCRLLLEKKK